MKPEKSVTPEQLQQIKEACEKALKRSITIDTDRWLKMNPSTVLSLVEEVERLRAREEK